MTPRRPPSLLPVLAVLVGCSGGTGPGTGPASPPEPGWHHGSLHHDGVDRRYRLYVPDATGASPLVVLLHGGTQSMDALFRPGAGGTQEWLDVADEEGVILLVPNGTNNETGAPHGDDQNWNDCRPRPSDRKVPEADDAGFVASLLDRARDLFAGGAITVDEERVFVTGASNGGMMTYRLATELPERFAGAAAFVANRPAPSECVEATEAVPVLMVNGTEDRLMPYDGGSIPGGRGEVLPAEATRDYWIGVNGADGSDGTATRLPDRDPDDGSVVVCQDYPAPAGSAGRVRFCRVEGGGHTMPSIEHHVVFGKQNHDVEGARLAWSFFVGSSR